MTKPLPKWIQICYSILWNKFKDEEFTYDQAKKVLEDKKGINVFFSDLRRAGWLSVELNEKDSRKRIYRLVEPNEAYAAMK